MSEDATTPIDFAVARARAEQLIAEAPRRQPSGRARCKGAREVLGMVRGLPGGEAAMYEPLRGDLERVSRAAGVSREELLALAAAGHPWPSAKVAGGSTVDRMTTMEDMTGLDDDELIGLLHRLHCDTARNGIVVNDLHAYLNLAGAAVEALLMVSDLLNPGPFTERERDIRDEVARALDLGSKPALEQQRRWAGTDRLGSLPVASAQVAVDLKMPSGYEIKQSASYGAPALFDHAHYQVVAFDSADQAAAVGRALVAWAEAQRRGGEG